MQDRHHNNNSNGNSNSNVMDASATMMIISSPNTRSSVGNIFNNTNASSSGGSCGGNGESTPIKNAEPSSSGTPQVCILFGYVWLVV